MLRQLSDTAGVYLVVIVFQVLCVLVLVSRVVRLRRIIRESLVNVARHSGARHCVVRLWPREGDLHVEITDDGVGTALDDVPAGTGLRSMRERAGALGGGCRVEPVSSGGTRIAAWLPLAAGR